MSLQRRAPLFLALAWTLLLVVAPPGRGRTVADEPPAAREQTPKSSAELLREGDRSARAGRYEEALSSWRLAFERRLPGFRKVVFKYPLEATYLDQAGLRARLLEDFRKEMPDEKVRAQEKSLVAFGFFGPRLDLKKTMLAVLTEEIAGFYDPDTKRLYLIREGTGDEGRKWWQKLLNSGFDAGEQKTVLIHEMSHALMDQHHDLLSMARSAEDDDDMSLAVTALIEGEATLCMMVGENPEQGEDLLSTPPRFMDAAFNLLGPFIYFAGGSSYRKAPRLVRESLMFPYLKGLSFCLALTSEENGTWKPVDAAFDRPPVSTEQILHPGKYRKDEPKKLSFPELEDALGPGWKAVSSNVLGEFQLRVLLSEKLAQGESEQAAAGWDGDLYRVYERAGGEGKDGRDGEGLLLAWASAWDSPEEARELAEAFARFLALRQGKEPEEGSDTAADWARTWRSDGLVTTVLVRGADAWVLQGVPEAAFPAVSRKALKLERSPKTFQLHRVKPEVGFPEDRRIRAERF